MIAHLPLGAAFLSIGCSVNSDKDVRPFFPDANPSDGAPGIVEAASDVGVEVAEGAGAIDDAAGDVGAASEAGATDTGGIGPPPGTGHSGLRRNKQASRGGNFLQPLLTRAKAASLIVDSGFPATFDAARWAS